MDLVIVPRREHTTFQIVESEPTTMYISLKYVYVRYRTKQDIQHSTYPIHTCASIYLLEFAPWLFAGPSGLLLAFKKKVMKNAIIISKQIAAVITPQ